MNKRFNFFVLFFCIIFFTSCQKTEKDNLKAIIEMEISNKELETNAYFSLLDYSKEHYEMYFLYVTKIQASYSWDGIIYLDNQTILYTLNRESKSNQNIDFIKITDPQLIKKQLLKENKFLKEGSMSNFGYLYKIFFRENKGHTLKVLDGNSYGFLLYFLRKENLNCN